jgi:hypothetical protein
VSFHSSTWAWRICWNSVDQAIFVMVVKVVGLISDNMQVGGGGNDDGLMR